MTREPSHTLPPTRSDAPAARAKPFGNFHVLVKLAEGAMGVVWVAAPWDNLNQDALVVLKTLRPEVDGGVDAEAFRQMFLDEARLAMLLEHRNIVRTFEAGFVNGAGYFAMEYLRGQTLHRLRTKLRKHGKLTLDAEVRILADTVAGLHYAHTLKSAEGEPLAVVHRDVAAQNIFVPYDGETRLLDFGVARASATAESGPVALAGRVRYMAPEQARRERSDPRGDIFAAGVLLAEAITGNRFWGDGDDNAILEALRLDAIPDPFHAAHDAALVNIVRHALRADPDARPQTIHALRTDLESWLARRPGRGDLGPLRSTMSSFFADERAKVSRTLDGLLTELREAPPAPPMVSEHRIIAIKVGDERLSQQLIPAMPVPLPAPVLSEPTIADADPVHDASNDWYEGPGSSGGMRSAFDRLVASQDRSELTTEDGPRRTRSSGSLAAFRAGEGFGLEGVPSVVGERDEDQSSRVEGLAPEDAPLAKPEVGPAPAAPPPTVVNGLPWPQVAIALVIAAAAFWLLGRY